HLAINGTTTLGSAFDRLELQDWNVAGQLAGIAEEPANFEFSARDIAVDMNAETVTMGEMALSLLNLRLTADVAPFSYAGTPEPQAMVRVEPFSLKDLM